MKKYLAAIAGLLILMTLASCGAQRTSDAPQLLEPVDVRVDVAQAKIDTIYNITSYDGEIVPHVQELQFVTDGIIDEVKVLPGELVEKDQVLVTLNEEATREQITALEEEKNNIHTTGSFSDRKMTIDIALAKLELEQMRQSGASQLECRLKEVDVQKLENELAQARQLRQMQLQELQRKLDGLQKKLENNQLTAPFSGRVVYIKAMDSGDSVKGYTTVICIADESNVSMATEYIKQSVITAADRIYVRAGDKEYDVEYIPYDDAEYVSAVLKGEELKSRFVPDAQAGELQVGQFAVLILVDSYKENVLTIPANALYQDKTGRYVYKMEDGQRVRCNVTVGTVTDVKAEILAGLEEGDVVYVKE